MLHLPPLIVDLALILTIAGFVSVLFRRIKQPVVLGYVIAGMLVGSKLAWLPSISDLPNVRVWADIGVIFLLFALGLEFSFKKLLRVGSAASMTAMVEMSAMIALGFGCGQWLGWSHMDSLFLGGIMAISSTTIIFRAFDELGVKGRRFVDLVFGILIVEDLVAILLLVLLSTVALRNQFEGGAMVFSIVKLGFFLVLWYLSGIFLIPSLLRVFRRSINEETLLVVAIGLCFFMVALASKAGFSPALGAFLMGSILAETTEAEKIGTLIRPVKDLFAAIFFVSVGVLINPELLLRYAGPVCLIALLLVVGKAVHVIFGALISGQSLRHAVQSGFSLAQIGEFSFIIAGLGDSLKVTSDFLYPIAVGVSVITTFSTPYMIKSAEPFYNFLERHLPSSWRNHLTRYSVAMQGVSHTGKWPLIIRSYCIRIIFNGILVVGIFALANRMLAPALASFIGEERGQWVALAVALFPAAPFLWAMAIGRPKSAEVNAVLRSQRYRAPVVMLELLRIVLAMALLSILAPRLISFQATLVITGSMAVLLLLVFSRHLATVYHWIETHFLRNLTQREDALKSQTLALAPWDVHLVRFDVDPDSPLVGGALHEIGIREKYGVTIAMIERGHKKIPAPGRNEKIFPFDRIFTIGDDEKLSRFRQVIEAPPRSDPEDNLRYGLQLIEIGPVSPFCSKTIRDSGLREQTTGLVVGIEREGQRILNPDAMTVLLEGDRLWVVGDSRRLALLNQQRTSS